MWEEWLRLTSAEKRLKVRRFFFIDKLLYDLFFIQETSTYLQKIDDQSQDITDKENDNNAK